MFDLNVFLSIIGGHCKGYTNECTEYKFENIGGR